MPVPVSSNFRAPLHTVGLLCSTPPSLGNWLGNCPLDACSFPPASGLAPSPSTCKYHENLTSRQSRGRKRDYCTGASSSSRNLYSALQTSGSLWGIQPPGDIWQCLETFFVVTTWGWGGVLQCTGQLPTRKNHQAQTASSAGVEKSCCKPPNPFLSAVLFLPFYLLTSHLNN